MSDKELEREIDEVLKAGGLDLLEFSVSRHRGALHVKAVIYGKKGTGTDECTKAYRLILPRVQMQLGVQDPYIEVYSPGIDRVIHTAREWQTFTGRFILFLTADNPEWLRGRIMHFENGTVQIETDGAVSNMPIASIVKAKLDSSYEGENAHGI
jgi:ribosome maturation factor RimP